MDLKLVLFVLASFLLVTARASYNDEELLLEAPTQSPMKAPAPAEVPASTPILLPTPSVEAPTPILPAKPPVLPAPHIKVSSPTKPTMRLECIPLCLRRCILQMRCYTACMKCCDRCKCVPPGVFGNRDKCGNCYTNMTTPSGWPMCP